MKKTRTRDRRRGAAMVEFGLAFGLFMVLFVATIEGGRLIWSWASLAHATREGARYAMVHGEANPVADSNVIAKVKDNAIGLSDTDINVNTIWADPDKTRGTQVEVDSTFLFRFAVSGITPGNSITLRSRSRVSVAN